MHEIHRTLAFAVSVALVVIASDRSFGADTAQEGKVEGASMRFSSRYLKGDMIVPHGVFRPNEAEMWVLPFLKANQRIIKGKRVLEIGGGSGINSIYAAQLGATRVVTTDISDLAIKSVNDNARRFGVDSVIETRLVPKSDTSAYSVINSGEVFDVILSNPPYSIDLDAKGNDAVTDTGDLGLSIVRGLPEYLAGGGTAILLYQTLFYHHLMVKFARLEGFEVRNHVPFHITPWETETLFNAYVARWAKQMRLDPKEFMFDWHDDIGLEAIRVKTTKKQKRLFPWNEPQRNFDGWIVVQRH